MNTQNDEQNDKAVNPEPTENTPEEPVKQKRRGSNLGGRGSNLAERGRNIKKRGDNI